VTSEASAGAGTIRVRPLADGELAAFTACNQLAFSEQPSAATVERDALVIEPDRAWVALDGDEVVGTAAVLSLEMTVPGGQVPVAGVTAVGVLPSHRRRGVLRRLLEQQQAAPRPAGEAVAALFASESGIYRRFGYGAAGEVCRLQIATRDAELVDAPVAPGRIRLLPDPGGALPRLQAAYQRSCQERPGMIRRDQRWWRWWWADQTAGEPVAPLLALHEQDGIPDGYVLYRVEPNWDGGYPHGRLRVAELVGAGPAIEAELWRYCLQVDLVAQVEAGNRPLDDPVRWWLADPRRLQLAVHDGLWVRLLEVAPALEARRYAVADRLVFDLTDPGRPHHAGRYLLEGGPDGARCQRTRRSAELTLDAAALGSAYLGLARLSQQARAGLLEESTPGAAARADRLLGWPIAPWCAEMF